VAQAQGGQCGEDEAGGGFRGATGVEAVDPGGRGEIAAGFAFDEAEDWGSPAAADTWSRLLG